MEDSTSLPWSKPVLPSWLRALELWERGVWWFAKTLIGVIGVLVVSFYIAGVLTIIMQYNELLAPGGEYGVVICIFALNLAHVVGARAWFIVKARLKRNTQ